MAEHSNITFFGKSFWDLWLQKIFRNIASAKYQFLVALFTLIAYGLFNINDKTGAPWITAAVGLGFLGGGFVTFATSRIYMNTTLSEDNEFSTDK